MDKLTVEDQETLITMDAVDRSVWHVYSSDPSYIAKLNKIAEPVRVDDWGTTYELSARQVLLRNVPKPKTAAQLAASRKAGERMNRSKRTA